MGSSIPKQYMDLCGRPVLYYSLKAFEDSFIDDVIIVTERVMRIMCAKKLS